MQQTARSIPHGLTTMARGLYWRSLWWHGRRALLLGGMIVGLCACTSPETVRTRGGGPGADVGNRSAEVEIHAGARPYYRTPCLITADCPDMQH
jgi:hypothetical protein